MIDVLMLIDVLPLVFTGKWCQKTLHLSVHFVLVKKIAKHYRSNNCSSDGLVMS